MKQTHVNRIMAVAGALLGAAVIAHFLGAPTGHIARDIALAAASLVALAPIAYRAWQAARFRAFSIELLVTVAVIGALIIGEYVEAAVVSFLFLFGAFLEARSLARTRSYLQGMIELAPTTALVRRTNERGESERIDIPADDLVEGDILLLTTGTRIAADAIVISGTAEVSEATITGEPMPVTKSEGDEIYAGTVVETGYIEAAATRVGAETTFSHIITLVEEAQETRTPTMRFLERFARIYTPAVIGLAILVGVLFRDVELGLTFLVIACPGALVISVPAAIVAGVGNLARTGVLVTSGEGIENLAKATTLILDKTGTLTRGEPAVVHMSGDSEVLRLAASVEVASEHHLARAIVTAAENRGLALSDVSDVEVTPGVGVRGIVDGELVSVGKLPGSLGASPNLLPRVEEWEAAGMTAVYVTRGTSVLGAIAIADEPRYEATQALAELRETGVTRVVMATGDNRAAATHVAGEVGIDEVHAGLLPSDKSRLIEEAHAKGEKVIMVGDGVNDAPALALADVGVAMGGAGTDVSQASADVILMTDRLDHLTHARRIAKKTANVMRQNTALALGTVVVLLTGVLMGKVGLASGMLVHEVSVIAVVLNALRIVRSGHKAPEPVVRERELANR